MKVTYWVLAAVAVMAPSVAHAQLRSEGEALLAQKPTSAYGGLQSDSNKLMQVDNFTSAIIHSRDSWTSYGDSGSSRQPTKTDTGPSSSLKLPHSSGEYMGHRWRIDEGHLMWWDGKPYVRFGFTGNGDPAQMIKAGFDQFTLMPDEQWPISGPDPEIVQRVDETSDQLEKAGVTYYGTLNAFWPWRYGNLIAESDKAAVFVRDVRDVTEHAGHRVALDLQIRLPIPDAHRDTLSADSTHAVLFDLERGTRHDVSRQIESVTRIDTTSDSDAWREGDAPPHDGPTIRVRMKSTVFPESSSLRLVLSMEQRSSELPGVCARNLSACASRHCLKKPTSILKPLYSMNMTGSVG